jgi:S1-C subfamily serine protease
LKVGDVLTQADGVAIEASERQDADLFATMMRAYKVGAKPEFTVIRAGQTMKIAAELTAAPKAESELKTYADRSFEFRARDVSFMDRVRHRWPKEQNGALISEIDGGGWAQVGGLQNEDLILSIDGHAVSNITDLEAQMKVLREKKPKRTTFFVQRGITTTYVELEPEWPEVK